jgi:hypothetical protein
MPRAQDPLKSMNDIKKRAIEQVGPLAAEAKVRSSEDLGRALHKKGLTLNL